MRVHPTYMPFLVSLSNEANCDSGRSSVGTPIFTTTPVSQVNRRWCHLRSWPWRCTARLYFHLLSPFPLVHWKAPLPDALKSMHWRAPCWRQQYLPLFLPSSALLALHCPSLVTFFCAVPLVFGQGLATFHSPCCTRLTASCCFEHLCLYWCYFPIHIRSWQFNFGVVICGGKENKQKNPGEYWWSGYEDMIGSSNNILKLTFVDC